MARDPSARFRKLVPSETGDLFEHYGVEDDPDRHGIHDRPSGTATVVAARACQGCGWYLGLGHRDPCPVCGETPRATT